MPVDRKSPRRSEQRHYNSSSKDYKYSASYDLGNGRRDKRKSYYQSTSYSRHSVRRSRSRSHSRSRYGNFIDNRRSKSRSYSNERRIRRRTRSRSRSYYERKRSSSKSYSNKRRSRSSSHSKDSKRSRTKNSSIYKYDKKSPESVDIRSNTPLKQYNKLNNVYEENSVESYEQYDSNSEPLDKEKIHKEIEDKLREALAKEGKIYPPRKVEASHPLFANDGSFLEIFKKMQGQELEEKKKLEKNEKVPKMPVINKRRGGRILKTGVVAKPKIIDSNNAGAKDFWSLYLDEVKKYKNTSCDIDGKTRPLTK